MGMFVVVVMEAGYYAIYVACVHFLNICIYISIRVRQRGRDRVRRNCGILWNLMLLC